MTGWIKLFRKITSCDWYRTRPYDKTHAWVDLLLSASYDRREIIRRGRKITVEPGAVATTQVELEERWGWSEGKITRYLKELQAMGQIEVRKNNVITIISITNWISYQSDEGADKGMNNGADKEADKGTDEGTDEVADEGANGGTWGDYRGERREEDKNLKKKILKEKISYDWKSFSFAGVGEENLAAWREAFPAVDPARELLKAALWLKANPANRKKNYERFLLNWLGRAQEKARRIPQPELPRTGGGLLGIKVK